MTKLTSRLSFGIASALAALTLVACGDAARPLASTEAPPARGIGGSSAAALASGASKEYFEVPVAFEGTLTDFACLDAPILFHVRGVSKVSVISSPSGIISSRVFFEVDRPNTWVIYKGLTYRVAQGRQTGQDDVGHTLVGPGGLYIESGTEPDFEVAETGERLRLNFHWQIVIGRDGTVRVSQVTGNCPLNFLG
jgi:hypothetical protein